MKSAKLLVASLTGLLLVTVQGQAQGLFHVTVKGSRYTADDGGNMITSPLNNQVYVQEAADALGRTNLTGLTLAYHLAGNEFGDQIVTVDTNGAPVFTNVALLFPVGVSNATQFAQSAEVFTAQSLASSNEEISRSIVLGRVTGKKVMINGTLQYDGTNTNGAPVIYNGTFTVGKALPTP
jgi:hypothetical protein